jgi:hypothetical protein
VTAWSGLLGRLIVNEPTIFMQPILCSEGYLRAQADHLLIRPDTSHVADTTRWEVRNMEAKHTKRGAYKKKSA